MNIWKAAYHYNNSANSYFCMHNAYFLVLDFQKLVNSQLICNFWDTFIISIDHLSSLSCFHFNIHFTNAIVGKPPIMWLCGKLWHIVRHFNFFLPFAAGFSFKNCFLADNKLYWLRTISCSGVHIYVDFDIFVSPMIFAEPTEATPLLLGLRNAFVSLLC